MQGQPPGDAGDVRARGWPAEPLEEERLILLEYGQLGVLAHQRGGDASARDGQQRQQPAVAVEGAAVVARQFDCPLVQPIEETPARSTYDLPASRCRIEFCVGGEDRGPVALASMTAKYVRELAMEAFNRFWIEQSPGLAPTAGYPVDAARWRRDAAAAIRAAGIAEDALWRRA